MKIKNLISVIRLFSYSVILLCICELKAIAEQKDTIEFPVDTVYVQVINFDSKTYSQIKNDEDFDYYQSKSKGYSIFDIIEGKIREFLRKHFNLNLSKKQITTILWVVVVLVVVTILLILYFFKPSIFYINKKKKIDFSVENEDIDALDFEKLISDSVKSGLYVNAIRWSYLQILKSLHLKELISYDRHKTVIEYVHEIKDTELKPVFKEITQMFLYYRYGNFEATREDWEDFAKKSKEIENEK